MSNLTLPQNLILCTATQLFNSATLQIQKSTPKKTNLNQVKVLQEKNEAPSLKLPSL
jgi:hypothetical protein